MSMKKNLSKLERVPLREAWKHEANDFTPWLAEADKLNTLADDLGLSELLLVAIEHWVGYFKLDILCTDGDDQVIIENQLDKANHTHLGQLIAYATGVGAKKVIWVAQSFRPEHAAALQFFNDNTTDDLSFFAVEVELWRIGDSPLAPKFEVVVKPNDWVRAGREQARVATSTSPTKLLQQKFWMALIERLAVKSLNIRPQKPRPQHWLNNSIGRSGFGLNITATPATRGWAWSFGFRGQRPSSISPTSLHKDRQSKTSWALRWTGRSYPMPWLVGSQPGIQMHPLKMKADGTSIWTWLTQRLVMMDQALRPIVKALP